MGGQNRQTLPAVTHIPMRGQYRGQKSRPASEQKAKRISNLDGLLFP